MELENGHVSEKTDNCLEFVLEQFNEFCKK